MMAPSRGIETPLQLTDQPKQPLNALCVASMLRGVSGNYREGLENNENKLQHVQHESGLIFEQHFSFCLQKTIF
jgi:hypothetical protein